MTAEGDAPQPMLTVPVAPAASSLVPTEGSAAREPLPAPPHTDERAAARHRTRLRRIAQQVETIRQASSRVQEDVLGLSAIESTRTLSKDERRQAQRLRLEAHALRLELQRLRREFEELQAAGR